VTTDQKLVYMANQIARNFACMGDGEAAAATADHLAHFWDPGMKARIINHLNAADHGLDQIAASAVERLRVTEAN
jgi:formate dehydrogenase subunit delta